MGLRAPPKPPTEGAAGAAVVALEWPVAGRQAARERAAGVAAVALE
jgi:hypothetical protein